MEIFTYLIKINTALVIFYLVYRLCYRNDTFFVLRRYILLSMLVLSVIYPFLDISNMFIQHNTFTDALTIYAQFIPEYTVTGPQKYVLSNIDLFDIIFCTYTMTCFFFILRLFFRIIQIIWIKYHTQKIKIECQTVHQLHTDTTPFSFFSWIFINTNMHNGSEIHEIITHETIHARQKHSLDIIFSELICACCWFNPVVWMLKKEIHDNLEFIVDNQVIKTGVDLKSYQYHLLRLAYHPSKITMANQFNVSPLKKRIIMLNKKESPKVKLTAYTLIIPLALLFVIVNNAGAVIINVVNSNDIRNVINKMSGVISPDQTVVSTTSVFEISGRIVDEINNKPLGGVNIIITGTHDGTISGEDGTFRLIVNQGTDLSISHIGYYPLSYTVKNNTTDIGTLKMKRKREEISDVSVVSHANQNRETTQTNNDQSEILMVVEQMPEFPGGINELLNYIAKNIKYPLDAQNKGIQGQVLCSFVVETDGKITNAKVIDGVYPSLDNEALRIINEMPLWNPGKQRGKAVSVEFKIPINFSLHQKN